MPTPPSDTLRKVTLNLFESDCALLEAHYGRGWSGIVRDIVSDHAQFIRRSTPTKTLGDLDAH